MAQIPSAICRSKNLHFSALKQFLLALPQKAMPKEEFENSAERKMKDFKRSHAQLAKQLALYYCDGSGICHPRFTHEMNEQEMFSYASHWAKHYFAPNPYTPSFPEECKPQCIYDFVEANWFKYDGQIDKILDSMFARKVADGDKVKSYLIHFTDIVDNNDGRICAQSSNRERATTAIDLDRNDAEAYFHYFDGWTSLSDVAIDATAHTDYSEKFIAWICTIKGKTKKTADNYLSAFRSLNAEEADSNHSTWPGIYAKLFGRNAEREVVEIGSLADFERVFGGFCNIFDNSGCPVGANPEVYAQCVHWVEEPEVKAHSVLSSAFEAYKSFLEWLGNQPQDEETQPLASSFLNEHTQIAYYGVPGSGKSFQVNADIDDILTAHGVEDKNKGRHKIRCVFHPDYCNADFVGQILPVISDKEVKYQFRPGPLATILYRALRDPSKPYFLIIEEINRGNAAAIFGELFQLLDRIKDGEKDSSTVNTYGPGWSAYDVENIDLNAYIRREDPNDPDSVTNTPRPFGGIEFSHDTAIRLPPNLSIYATMNTSDQNVFAMDNAFQRRFGTKLIRNKLDDASQYNIEIEGTGVCWGAFREWINPKILAVPGLSKAEDKQLGGWFISTPKENDVNRKPISRENFAEKVLKYLWNDVFKRDNADCVFNKDNEHQTLSEMIVAFEEGDAKEAFSRVFKLSDNDRKDLKKKYGDSAS